MPYIGTLTQLGTPRQHYPSKPVTLVAVFGSGSASDTNCRVIAQPLSVALKESVIVENRPGANGARAALYVARSALGWPHAADGDQLPAFNPSVPDEEREL
jgi:tripartite-type tricarboxylate transporter receptor subunit TctC